MSEGLFSDVRHRRTQMVFKFSWGWFQVWEIHFVLQHISFSELLGNWFSVEWCLSVNVFRGGATNNMVLYGCKREIKWSALDTACTWSVRNMDLY